METWAQALFRAPWVRESAREGILNGNLLHTKVLPLVAPSEGLDLYEKAPELGAPDVPLQELAHLQDQFEFQTN